MNHGFPLTTKTVLTNRIFGLVSGGEALDISIIFCVRHIIGKIIDKLSAVAFLLVDNSTQII